MPLRLADKLRDTIVREAPQLRALREEETAHRPAPDKWSRREELGHLIDSATNNHVRFVLGSTMGEFRGLGYAQDTWVEAHAYNEASWILLVELWHHYNLLMAHLVERIPDEAMNNRCVIGWGVSTLDFVIEDYIVHMQHHLDHVLGRDAVTRYPASVYSP